jgi:hypothetical protein
MSKVRIISKRPAVVLHIFFDIANYLLYLNVIIGRATVSPPVAKGEYSLIGNKDPPFREDIY